MLRERPDLASCAVCCCHCGIRFFTHPRNAGREYLGCPFGCREHHRRQRSQARSRAYYQTVSGKRKKKRLNGRRYGVGVGIRQDATHPTRVAHVGADVSQAARAAAAIDAPDANSSAVEPPRELAASAVRPEALTAPSADVTSTVSLSGFVLDEPTLMNSRLLPHARLVASLIEGRPISHEELVTALGTRLRQHRIGRRTRREYVLDYLHEHSPQPP